MFKNVASQTYELQAIDSATGRPKTGDAANITPYVSKDGGTVTALATATATEISATNAPGVYRFSFSQAETNADRLLISAKSSTSGIDLVPAVVNTLPANFTALSIDVNGRVKIQGGIQKNVALPNYAFTMTDSTTHNPVNGKTVTVTRLIDGGAFGAGTIANVAELADGNYKCDFGAGDLNGTCILAKFTADGCDTLFVLFVPTP